MARAAKASPDLAVGGCVLLALHAALASAASPPQFLLPDDVSPSHYKVDLTIDPNLDTFEGLARIGIDVRKASSVLWLNAKDLTIDRTTVRAGGQERAVQAETFGGEFLGLELNEPLRTGPAEVSIHYRGRLNEKPVAGAYRVRFEGSWYVFTSFTPIDARRAIPCFDEPRFKTPWELTIHVKREYAAFANSPSTSVIDESGGMKAVRFAPTGPLSSEVVAFAVGPLDILEGGLGGSRSVPVRVITPKAHAAEGAYALRATAEVLPKLEEYTGIPYPYTKLDHVALPRGAFGAVENPGLITYRMNGLLIPKGEDSGQKERAIRAIQAHELAHQWFGNLVTQAVWEDVWLSEGFATWLSQKIMDQEQPAARRHLTAIGARERIMIEDAGPKTHPVRLRMHDRDSMNAVYNQFPYQKGSAVLLMIEGWMGEERFRDGLRAYLQQHRFGTARTSDLAGALLAASGHDPAPVLHSFLDHSGVPAVSAALRCEPRTAAVVTLQQTGSWTVPLCWRAEGMAMSCTVLDRPNLDLKLPVHAGCPAFLELNAGGNGYYRTAYTREQLAALVNHRFDLTPAERLTIVYDMRFLERTGRLEKASAKAFLDVFTTDTEPEIARAATGTESLGR